VGTNEEFGNKNLIKLICKVTRSSYDDLVIKIKDRLFNAARYSISRNKITKLGWRPKKKHFSLKEIFE